MCYIIIKEIEKKGSVLPVIMLDSHEEVWEFKTKEEAEAMAAVLEVNSHTKTKYKVKKI